MAINKGLSCKNMTLYKNTKMMSNTQNILNKLDLSENEIKIYTTIISLGSSSVRKIAEKAGLNRGVAYNSLKLLEQKGLVSYFHKAKNQHFVAENPDTLKKILLQKKSDLESTEKSLDEFITKLNTISGSIEDRPVVKFYENHVGIKNILEDVLESVAKLPKKEYVAYSSSTIRPYLYGKNVFPNFNTTRIKKKIFVRTISNGEGGTTYGKDERKWLSKEESSPTYKLIYAGKVAMISVGKNNALHGIIIEDKNLFDTELSIFNALWKKI